MKRLLILLALGFVFALPTIAQEKGVAKKLCRIWLPDKATMLIKLAGKPNFERVKGDTDTDEVFLYFQKNGVIVTGEPERIKETTWKLSPDNKVVSFQSTKLTIIELSDQKFTFLIAGGSEDETLYFIPATKQETKKLLKKIKEKPTKEIEKRTEPSDQPKKECR